MQGEIVLAVSCNKCYEVNRAVYVNGKTVIGKTCNSCGVEFENYDELTEVFLICLNRLNEQISGLSHRGGSVNGMPEKRG